MNQTTDTKKAEKTMTLDDYKRALAEANETIVGAMGCLVTQYRDLERLRAESRTVRDLACETHAELVDDLVKALESVRDDMTSGGPVLREKARKALDSVSVQLQAKVDAKAPKKVGKAMEALLASMALGDQRGNPFGGVGFGGPAGASMLEAILGPRASGPFGPFGQR